MKYLKSGFLVLLCLVTYVTIAQPTITSFTPSAAKPGDVVTITGTNFNTTAASNIVFFGATRANVTTASSTGIVVTVPVGATYGPITVLNTATSLIAYSTQHFNPIYSPAKTGITSTDFAAKQDVTTSAAPRWVAVGDIDGDGKTDVVVAYQASNTISVFRNTSTVNTISFAAGVDFATGASPAFVAVGDINGDGKLDIAVANTNDASVSLLRNTSTNGNINFAAKVDVAVGTAPRFIAYGDIDNDGKIDLAVANSSSSSVSILRNTSSTNTISLATKVDFTTPSFPVSVSIGDLDNDGKIDMVTANQFGENISVFKNTSTSGAISFNTNIDYSSSTGPIGVIIADLNGDNKNDIAVAVLNSNRVSVFRNTSTSNTISFATRVNFTTGTSTASISIADFDGDGKPDIVTGNSGSTANSASVLRNTSTTSTINFTTKVDFAVGTSPTAIAAADINGDSRQDFITANGSTSSRTFSVFRNVFIPSNNANLNNFVISSGTLSPAFNASTTEYTVSVPNSVTTFSVTPTLSNTTATMRVNFNVGSFTTITSGTASQDYILRTGSNSIEIRVTAEDGTTVKVYTIFITRATSNDASLSALTMSSGTLSPIFSPNTTTYSANVLSSVGVVTFTATASELNASLRIRINGNPYIFTNNGSPSGGMVLNVGTNTVDIQITAQDGTTIKTYTITVNRPTNIADLSALTISSGTLSPTFVGGITDYTASVTNLITGITVRPSIAVTNAMVRVNVNGGTFINVSNNANSSNLALNVGTNIINVQVTAADGVTVKTYKLTITRALSNNANLSNITFSVGFLNTTFSGNIVTYSVLLQNNTTSITFTPTLGEANATIQYRVAGGTFIPISNGAASAAIPVSLGSNIVDVLVTAQDGVTTKTYSINVIRPSNNADLSNLTFSAGSLSPTFSSNVTEYVVTTIVNSSLTNLTVTPTLSDTNATIQVSTWTGFAGVTEPRGLNGVSVSSGTASPPFGLLGNSTIIEIRVFAQDGTTSKVYNIRVVGTANSNANLTALSLTTGTLSPAFSANTTAYTANVLSSTSSVRVNFTSVGFPGTTQIRLSGGAYTSFSTTGSGPLQSQQINLGIGSNTIEILVMAPDGVTTKLYTITVFRPGAGNPDLSNLIISNGTLSPSFSAGTVTYTASVGNNVTGITITPTKADANTTIQVGLNTPTETVASGTASSSLPLAVGINTIQVRVTNIGGSPSKTYTIWVERIGDAPTITSFTPVAAKPGDVVTINGTNFRSTQPNDNIVYFGATKATINAVTPTQLTVVVPTSALHAPISYINTNAAVSATSTKSFNPIYAPAKNTITATDFGERQNFSLGTTPKAVAFGDIDGDGKADMITTDHEYPLFAGRYENNVSIFLNTSNSGMVSFAPRVRVTFNQPGLNVKVADMDGDGKLDLIVQGSISGQNINMAVYRNSSTIGNISFSLVSYVSIANKYPVNIAIADIDGDGLQDIVAGHNIGFNFSVLRNTSAAGTITFAPAESFPVNFNSGNVSVADFDGDGKIDVLTSDYSICRNTSTPGKISFATYKNIFDAICNSIKATDIDGDGKVDVIGESSGGFFVLRNNSNIGIINFDRRLAYTPIVSGTTRSIEVADINGDNKPDLLLTSFTNRGVNNISIYQNISTPNIIHFAAQINIATGAEPVAIAACDLDGDAKPDIASVNQNNNNVSVFRNLDIVLPIVLKDFTVKKDNTIALLEWVSTEETNAKQYEIEKSYNGTAFTQIGIVATKGYASSYTFTNALPTNTIQPTTIYYRLKLVNSDGTYSYSAVKTIQLLPNKTAVSLYPNPVKDRLNIVVNNALAIKVYNSNGKIVYQQSVNSNSTSYSISTSNFANGMYFIQIHTKSGEVINEIFMKN